jgi:hypothetical protein
MPGGVEVVVECFEEDGCWIREAGVVVEECDGFGGVGDGGLFEENVLSGAEGFEGPFVVEAVGEGNVDCVDDGVVE